MKVTLAEFCWFALLVCERDKRMRRLPLCCVCCDAKIDKICAPVWTRSAPERERNGAQGRAGERQCAVCGAMTHPHSGFLVCAQSANTRSSSAPQTCLLPPPPSLLHLSSEKNVRGFSRSKKREIKNAQEVSSKGSAARLKCERRVQTDTLGRFVCLGN